MKKIKEILKLMILSLGIFLSLNVVAESFSLRAPNVIRHKENLASFVSIEKSQTGNSIQEYLYEDADEPSALPAKEAYLTSLKKFKSLVDQPFKVYNITVEGTHNYYVLPAKGGELEWAVRTHNTKCVGGNVQESFVPDEYWKRHSPNQVTPGTNKTSRTKLSSDGTTTYQVDDYYDEYGRLKGSTHHTDHPNLKGDPHPNPHHHKRNVKYGDPNSPHYKHDGGKSGSEYLKNTETGSRVWDGEYED